MTVLDTRSKDTIVSTIAAGMQGRLSGVFLNFAKGKVFRALAEAVAGVCLWLQKNTLSVLKLTRLSTSYGADADSWVADFGIIERIGAVAATGLVTFSRFTASGSMPLIAVGALVKTQDGTQSFTVYADATNPAYSSSLVGYVLPAQVTSLIVPVVSVTPNPNNAQNLPGSNGNVAAGSISVIASSIPGIDAVTNPAAFTNGSDDESDPDFKAAFRLAIASLSKGTAAAFELAINRIKTGMQVSIMDGYDLDGTVDHGMVTIIVDDGSGAVSSGLVSQCAEAINSVRAGGIRVGVYAASVAFADVAMSFEVEAGYYAPTVEAQVTGELGLKINGLGLGNGLSYFDLADWIKSVAGVRKITALTLNGGRADIPADPRVTIKARYLTVA